MSITRDQALELLRSWTQSASLLGHARAVELAMRSAAARYGQGADAEQWALTGLLHDADYERWPEEHPRRIVDWLLEQGEEDMAHAVSAHNTSTGVVAQTPLAKALLAIDELAGFVIACALVRPEGITTLEPKSVRKKLKDKAFAAKVDREEIRRGVEQLGVELDPHIQLILDALRPHAEELGVGKKG